MVPEFGRHSLAHLAGVRGGQLFLLLEHSQAHFQVPVRKGWRVTARLTWRTHGPR